ncbi:MAG: hypothetical protein IH820_08350 [Bacteroidetes bacterium]|nr:hypothetical protein [Bacteroidota bacterium]
MKFPRLHSAETTFVDTPEGIYTASGVWFRTREDSLYAYAGPVFDREPLARLFMQAEVWLRSPMTLALWLLPLLLFMLSPLQAALAVLVVYVGWESLGPSFVSRTVVRVFRVLDLVLLQALYYVLAMSVLAAQQQFAMLWVGLGGFILLRWGLVRMATQPVIKRIWATLYRMPVPDQVLRSFIIRAALKYRVSLPELDRIEQEILENLKRK